MELQCKDHELKASDVEAEVQDLTKAIDDLEKSIGDNKTKNEKSSTMQAKLEAKTTTMKDAEQDCLKSRDRVKSLEKCLERSEEDILWSQTESKKELKAFEKQVEGWCIDETLKATDLEEAQSTLQDKKAKLEAKLKKIQASKAEKCEVDMVKTRENPSPKPKKVVVTNPVEEYRILTDSSEKESGSPEAKRKKVSWRDESGSEAQLEDVKTLTQSQTSEAGEQRPTKKRGLIYDANFDSDSSDDIFSVMTPTKVKTYERKSNNSMKGMKFFRSRGGGFNR